MPVASPPRQRMNLGLSQAHGKNLSTGSSKGLKEGGGGGGGGGGGSKAALAGFGEGDQPGFAGTGGSGLLGLLSAMGAFDRSPKLSEATKAKKAALEQQLQSAQDVYGEAIQRTGNPNEALLAVMRDPSSRALLFTHPEAFNGVAGIHKLLNSSEDTASKIADRLVKQDQGGQRLAQGNRRLDQSDQRMAETNRHNLVNEGQGAQRIDQGQQRIDQGDVRLDQGQQRVDQGAQRIDQGQQRITQGDLRLQQGQQRIDMAGQKAALGKPLTSPETTALNGLQMILSNIDKMRNNVEATGSFGYGHITRFAAEHTPLPAEQARAYEQAYNDVKAALPMLSGNARIKAVVEAQFERLPKPGQAEAMNAHQAIQDLGLQTRVQLGDMVRNLKESGKAVGTATDMAKTFEAGPNMTSVLRNSYQKIQSSPGQMTDDEVAPLMYEMEKGRLPYDVSTRVLRQAVQRGMISPEEYGKAAQAMPELNDIKDNERVANPRQWQNPNQPQPQETPAGPQVQQPQPQPAQGPAPQPKPEQHSEAAPEMQTPAPQVAENPMPQQQAAGPYSPQEVA